MGVAPAHLRFDVRAAAASFRKSPIMEFVFRMMAYYYLFFENLQLWNIFFELWDTAVNLLGFSFPTPDLDIFVFLISYHCPSSLS